MKTKRIKRSVCYLVVLLIFGLILYSCLQDETDLDSQETTGKIIKGKKTVSFEYRCSTELVRSLIRHL